MDSLEPQLQQLLEQHKAHFTVQDNGKILCTINGHTLPPRHAEVFKFIEGPKFQKLLKRHQAEHMLQKFEPFIVQSKNFPLMLYCALTGQLMDKSVAAVKKHMQGKKFLRAKDRFTNDEVDLQPEPSLESFGIKVPKDDSAAGADDAAAAEDSASKQQQQRSSKGPKQKQKAAAANGATANGAVAASADVEGSGHADEPAFWVPSDVDGSSDAEGEAEERAAGGSDADMVDEQCGDAEAAADGDPMEEDVPAQQQQQQQKVDGRQQAAAVRGSRKQQQQLGHPAVAGKAAGAAAAAAAAAAAGGKKKKQKNANRPSAAKKAKR